MKCFEIIELIDERVKVKIKNWKADKTIEKMWLLRLSY
jgi:hypothetical protein